MKTMTMSALACGALLSGCATSKPKIVYALPPNCVVADEIPMESTINVRVPDTVKAYPVARYVDPVNKNILHERTVIYRVEENSRWKLRPDQPDKVLLGTVVGVKDPHYVAGPLPSELQSELQWQKKATKQVLDMGGVTQRLVEVATQIQSKQDQIIAGEEANKIEMARLQKRVNDLQKGSAPPATPASTPAATTEITEIPQTTERTASSPFPIPANGGLPLKR